MGTVHGTLQALASGLSRSCCMILVIRVIKQIRYIWTIFNKLHYRSLNTVVSRSDHRGIIYNEVDKCIDLTISEKKPVQK